MHKNGKGAIIPPLFVGTPAMFGSGELKVSSQPEVWQAGGRPLPYANSRWLADATASPLLLCDG